MTWLITSRAACAGSADVSLAAELDVLLHLLAVSPQLACSAAATEQQPSLFPTGAAAALYAGHVLRLAGQPFSPLPGSIAVAEVYLVSARVHSESLTLCTDDGVSAVCTVS